MFKLRKTRMNQQEKSKITENQEHNNPDKTVKKASVKNKEFVHVAYLFIGLFLAMILYFTYFQMQQSETFINNPYNKRLDSFTKKVVRGDIVANDGTVLATSKVNSDGTETRHYPYDSLYAHAVGYSSRGTTGIEQDYNFELLRSHSFIIEKALNEMEGKKNLGDTVVTTFDHKLQSVAYESLGSKKGAVIVSEPKSGKILAMVSKPDYNPNTIVADWDKIVLDETSESALYNRATQGLYPPGSVFKIVTTLGYYRQEGLDSKFTYNCDGSITAGQHTIHCFNNKEHGKLTIKDAFAESCNSAYGKMGTKLSSDVWEETTTDLLFGTALPTTLTSEKSVFHVPNQKDKAEQISVSIGQGKTLVTPLHMNLLTCSIYNDGELMVPYLVERIENSAGSIKKRYKEKSYGSLMTPEEAKALRKLMKAVVKDGTASALQSDSYEASGKTGSAEYGTTKGNSHGWFTGYAKTKGKNAIAVTVLVEDGGTGSGSAVPIAKSIFQEYSK